MSQLPEKMRAVVCHGPQDYRFEQVPTPLPKARELVIKVEGCGICAGDCKCKNGAQMFWGRTRGLNRRWCRATSSTAASPRWARARKANTSSASG